MSPSQDLYSCGLYRCGSAKIVVACIVVAYMGMAYIVMAHMVMAYIVMTSAKTVIGQLDAGKRKVGCSRIRLSFPKCLMRGHLPTSTGLYSYGLYSCGHGPTSQ